MLDSKTGPWSELFLTGAEKTWTLDLAKDDLFLRYTSSGDDYISKFLPNKILNGRLNPVVWPIIEAINLAKLPDSQARINSGILQVDTPERWSSISIKTLVALRYCLDNVDFDFVIRGNATSFFNIAVLRSYLESSQTNYVGPIHKNKPFASGWAIGMSRQATTYLVKNFDYMALRYFDDEAFGTILAPMFGCEAMPYLEFSHLEELKNVSRETLSNIPAIRTKSLVGGLRMDAVIQQNIYRKIKGEQ